MRLLPGGNYEERPKSGVNNVPATTFDSNVVINLFLYFRPYRPSHAPCSSPSRYHRQILKVAPSLCSHQNTLDIIRRTHHVTAALAGGV